MNSVCMCVVSADINNGRIRKIKKKKKSQAETKLNDKKKRNVK